MMKKILSCVLIALCAFAATAHDVIVLRNGDIIAAKVQKISKNEIEYKKATNLDGPTYTIEKNDVLAINYENGEKDQFDHTNQDHEPDKTIHDTSTPKYLEPIPASNNQELIGKYNSSIPSHRKNMPDQKSLKKTNDYIEIYGITPESILSDENVEVSLVMNDNYYQLWNPHFGTEWHPKEWGFIPNYKVVIKNKTKNLVYVNVIDSYRIAPDGTAESFYNDMTVSHTTTAGGGVSVGLGSIASAIGVGGIVGSLASGISAGTGQNSSTTVMENEAAIIRIPPGGKITMPAKKYTNDKKNKSVENYEFIDCTTSFEPSDVIEKWRFTDCGNNNIENKTTFMITYSMQADFSQYSTLSISLYPRGYIGTGKLTSSGEIISDNGFLLIGKTRSRNN